MIQFKNIALGEQFYEPNSGEYFLKVCGNAAEHLAGGENSTGQLCTFDEDELVKPYNPVKY
jgi:hypothetical protein